MMKKATFGVLAASLIFSQAAFADQASTTTTNTDTTANAGTTTTATTTSNPSTTPATTGTSVSTTTSTTTNTSVGNDPFSKKLDKIEAKFDQFKNQKVPAQALLGKLGAVQNRVNALENQLDKIAELQKQIDTLDIVQAAQANDTLTALYDRAGDLQSAIKAEREFVQKKLNKKAKDEDILKEYKELGKLLRKSGKVGIQALVNGQEPNMDVQPVIENGRTLLPFRALAESLGAQVSFDPATRTVTVTKGDIKVVLTIDSVAATVNGQPYTLDVPAKVEQGRTLIPLRFLGQSLNAKVLWEQETQMAIVIGDQNEVPPTTGTTTTTGTTEVTPTTGATTGTTGATSTTGTAATGTTGATSTTGTAATGTTNATSTTGTTAAGTSGTTSGTTTVTSGTNTTSGTTAGSTTGATPATGITDTTASSSTSVQVGTQSATN